MKYKEFGNTGKKVSILGFGAMRLPLSSHDQRDIIENDAIALIRRAIDEGINYVDTAYPYHAGRSEPIVGKALSKEYRDKTYLADKFPCWMIRGKGDFERILSEQLKRLKTDRIDFYLMHALNKHTWGKLLEVDIMPEVEKAKADGRIGHIGFSFHDGPEVFKQIINEYDRWEFCQIQYNYMDTETQAGTAGLEFAGLKHLPVVVMEPLRGGQLTASSPKPIADLWQSFPLSRSAAEWAFRFVWNRAEVSIALSGMNSTKQLEENLALADHAETGVIGPEEMALYEKVRKAYGKLQPVPCTGCRYCMPCPQKVHIPDILKMYNEMMMYNSPIEPQRLYNHVMTTRNRADRCVECGQCESACPQHIEIISWLKKAHQALSFT